MIYDCIVIGGGQAGLACGYYLNKSNLNYLILDNQKKAGGAWLHTWENLHIFSPAESSSLPGYFMPKTNEEYPHKDNVIKYLTEYEKRYNLKIGRPIEVKSVAKEHCDFILETNNGIYKSKTIIAASGTWSKPVMPKFQGMEKFEGQIIHSANYYKNTDFKGKKVFVIGAGNSGAQIVADLCDITETYWIVNKEPRFLPEDVDGRYLFSLATTYYREKRNNPNLDFQPDLGDIVQIPSVKKALTSGKLNYYFMFDEIDEKGAKWGDKRLDADVIILCTGFKSSFDYLGNLGIIKENRIKTRQTKAIDISGLWLVGLGNWTGFASATLIGVGRYARETVSQIKEFLDN